MERSSEAAELLLSLGLLFLLGGFHGEQMPHGILYFIGP